MPAAPRAQRLIGQIWRTERAIGAALVVSALNVTNERWWQLGPVSRALRAEDHVVEWTTFAVFVAAGAVAWRVALRASSARHRTTWLTLAIATLFVAGEEVAWLQRVIGFATPARLSSLNSQGEATVHNLVLNGLPLTTWVFAYGLAILLFGYFFGLPWLRGRHSGVSKGFLRWGVPIPPPAYGVALVALLVINHVLAPGTSGNEVMEMGGAVVWLRLMMRGSTGVPAAGSAPRGS